MSDNPQREQPDLVTLTVAQDLASARLFQGLLQSAGIECFIPDENMLSQASYLSGIAGGLRVQVRSADRERAQELLNDFATPDSPESAQAPEEALPVASQERSAAEQLAQRALRVAILGFILWPLPHPYALALAISALRRKELTGPARRQARVALLVSAGAIVAFAIVLYSLLVR
jgi:hypothetical protein